MQDFAETLLNTVAAMSAASFGYFGVTLKDEPVMRAARPEPAVVRRVPAPAPLRQAMVVPSARTQPSDDCPDKLAVKV